MTLASADNPLQTVLTAQRYQNYPQVIPPTQDFEPP